MSNTKYDAQLKSELTDASFERVAQLAKANWGLNLESGKRPLVTARLWKRVLETGSKGFDSYLDKVSRGDHAECDFFISALTTNVTKFFREFHHFEFLAEKVLPNFNLQQELRIWSAGCSSGQEPYSIAATVRSVFGDAMNARILATDIDTTILEKARAGKYRLEESVFPTRKFEENVLAATKGESAFVRPELQKMIDFRRLNLVQPWPVSGKFDVIFCRNVLIYFDKNTQQKLCRGFSERLKPGGYLFIGHSERIIDPSSVGLISDGITTYRKLES